MSASDLRRGLVIAVDGPSGSGKSTAARRVAVALRLRYLDTGSMYRALTWWLLHQQVDVADTAAVIRRLEEPVITVVTDPRAPRIMVNGADVGGQIRTREVSNAVSAVAVIPQVRHVLVGMQQEIIAEAVAAGAGIVAEGRDIGTVVAPRAAVKVYLTASETARAKRRSADLADDPAATVATIQREQARRDRKDSGQMAMAADAARDRHDRTRARRRGGRDRPDGQGLDGGVPWLSQCRPARTASRPSRPRCWRSSAVPNVGKSTLVNRILGSRQAVVEDVPGVTRDRVTYDATWRGRAFTLVDTGGWEPSTEGTPVLAAQVAAQARVAVDAADAILFVVDAVVGVTDADAAVAAVLRRTRKPVVLAANKVDDAPGEPEVHSLWSLGLGEPMAVSALHGRGSGDLLDAILNALPETPEDGTSPRAARAGSRSSAGRTWASRAC